MALHLLRWFYFHISSSPTLHRTFTMSWSNCRYPNHVFKLKYCNQKFLRWHWHRMPHTRLSWLPPRYQHQWPSRHFFFFERNARSGRDLMSSCVKDRRWKSLRADLKIERQVSMSLFSALSMDILYQSCAHFFNLNRGIDRFEFKDWYIKLQWHTFAYLHGRRLRHRTRGSIKAITAK